MILFHSKDFMKEYNSKNDTLNEFEVQRVFSHPKCPEIRKNIPTKVS